MDEVRRGGRERETRAGAPGGVRLTPTMLLQVIARERPRLTRAERRIAEFVLQHPESVITMNMADLKAVAGVSDPVTAIRNRLCDGQDPPGWER